MQMLSLLKILVFSVFLVVSGMCAYAHVDLCVHTNL